MKVFVIHSGADRELVKEKIGILRDKTASSEYLMLTSTKKIWKAEAKRKIKKSQLVIFFVGENSHNSKNIGWEIEKAIKLNKQIITVKLDKSFESHKSLTVKKEYSMNYESVDKEFTMDELISYINDYSSSDYSLFNQSFDEMDKAVLLEQYKMFLKTSEDLVVRRQNVSSFYVSVSSALVAIYAAVIGIGDNAVWKNIAGFIFAAIGIILCVSWIRIIRSYGNLNASKMKIISIIEKEMPASMYDAEWRVQSDKLNSKPYVSFTESEIRIPKLLIAVYVSIIILSIVMLIYSLTVGA